MASPGKVADAKLVILFEFRFTSPVANVILFNGTVVSYLPDNRVSVYVYV